MANQDNKLTGERLRDVLVSRMSQLDGQMRAQREQIADSRQAGREGSVIAALTTAQIALSYVRDVMDMVAPGLDTLAASAVADAEHTVAPDPALHASAVRLVHDILHLGILDGPIHPEAWPLTDLGEGAVKALAESNALEEPEQG
jgi:hypothetical protein